MPAQYTLPPDTRAVGTGNPPADMNAVVDALTAAGAARNVLSATFSGGADPTGVADSTTAIQAALTAASNSTVYFPAGIYKVSSALTVKAGTTLLGDGNGASIIRLAASAAVAQVLGVTATQLNYSVTISDLQIDGNKANSATATHGIYLFGGSDCIIQRVRVVNVSGNAITLDGSGPFTGTACKVADCYVRTCGGDGLHVNPNATDTIVTGCDFGSCTGKAYYFNGIQAAVVGSIGWGSSEGIVVDGSSGEVWIAGCRFDQNQFYGAWFLAHNVTMTGCLIYDNSATGTGTQPGILVDSGSADVVIAGCRSVGGLNSGPQHSYGLQVNGTGGSRGALLVSACDFLGNGTGSVSYAGMSTAGDKFTNVLGYNPVGVVTPAVPLTTVAVAAINYDRTFYITTAAGVSTFAIQGGPTITIPATGFGTVRVPAGQTLTPTYTNAPTWVVEGE